MGSNIRFRRLLPVIAILLSGCFTLDDNLFNATPIASYTLRTSVIPDSARESVVLQSQGNSIYGFFVRGAGPYSAYTVLYCHGNRDNIEFYWDRAEFLYQAGFSLFIFDYQGYGMSGGSPSEEALYADGRAALTYVRGRGDVDQNRIIFYGFSLGNVVSIDLAANVLTPHTLIAESPFASAGALVRSATLLDISSSYVMTGEYRNDEKIRRVSAPLLLLHGTDDVFLDIDANGAVVFTNANDPKEFVRVQGAGHDNVPQKLGLSQYTLAVQSFIQNRRTTP